MQISTSKTRLMDSNELGMVTSINVLDSQTAIVEA
jgi:hypothetical protein